VACSSSAAAFETQKSQKRKLEQAPVYPNAANLEKETALISEFEASVDALHDQLKTYQRPLEAITDRTVPSRAQGHD